MKPGPFPLLQTQRLILRQMIAADAPAVLTIFGDPRVTRFYDLGTMRDLEEAKSLIQRQGERFQLGTGIRWGIVSRAHGTLIGTCGFHLFPPGYRAGIGYDLAHAWWRQGYMSEALKAMLQYGFRELDLHRVEALVLPGNVASQRLLARLGFRQEGLLREYAFFRDEFHDLLSFSLLAHEHEGEG